MQVSKWGNSLAVRLPKKLVEEMALAEGDEVDIVDIVNRTLVIQKEERRQQALDNMKRRRWRAPADYRFDRDEANKR